MANLRIGTSGWDYAHWVGRFYPRSTRPEDFLGSYATRFNSVEINSTFYRLPSVPTLAHWRDGTPDDFVFACKASRFITHMKKLKEPRTSTRRFFAVIATLGAKLGPVLFQLPPRWRADPARLERFLARLPREHRFAFEFRDESWLDDAVYGVLRRHRAALCAYELTGRVAPFVETGEFDYVRLHGPGEAYRGRYGDAALDAWAEALAGRLARGRDVYCYFDNDEAGYAASDAQRLRDRILSRAPA